MPHSTYTDSKIIITGGTGTIGLELARSLLKLSPKEVCLLSNDEDGLFNAMVSLAGESAVSFRFADVRERRSLDEAFRGFDVVIHAAALKHVDLCQSIPKEVIKTNVLGTRNAAEAASDASVDLFVFVSSDKAVNPKGVYGKTKQEGEELTIRVGEVAKRGVFCCVRFGNVLGSRGSVIRIFERQVRAHKSLTVTNPDMTRFVLLPGDAANAILATGTLAQNMDIITRQMPAVRIGDLALSARSYFGKKFGIDPGMISLKTIGVRPGEKTHEELMTRAEAVRATKVGRYYRVPVALNRRHTPPLGSFPALSSKSTKLLKQRQIVRLLSHVPLEVNDG